MRTIYLPAIGRTVTLRAYIAAVKMAKSHPGREFNHGLTTWWPTYGSEVVKQFLNGVHDRINQRIPYSRRGV